MLYGPDKNLGAYAMEKSNIVMDLWPGFCGIHNGLKPEMVAKAKSQWTNALFIAHPECKKDVLNMADYIGSTKQLIEYVESSNASEFIIGTEEGVIHEMQKRCPNKIFHLLNSSLRCFEMKLTKLEDLYNCLLNETNEIEIPDDVMNKARKCVDKMLELSK